MFAYIELQIGWILISVFFFSSVFFSFSFYYRFRLSYRLILREKELHFNLAVYNPNHNCMFPFHLLLHTYFKVPDVRKCQITGLHGCPFIDKVLNFVDFDIIDSRVEANIHLRFRLFIIVLRIIVLSQWEFVCSRYISDTDYYEFLKGNIECTLFKAAFSTPGLLMEFVFGLLLNSFTINQSTRRESKKNKITSCRLVDHKIDNAKGQDTGP